MTTSAIALGFFGGLAMLLYGIRLVGEGLQLAAGGHLRAALQAVTRNRVKGLLAGAGITAIIQSSGATTVMLVGFASAGLIRLPEALGVVLGADIGTTVTVQLIAFQVADYALVLVGVGFACLFVAKRHVVRYAGEAILGFGLIFLAIQVIGQTAVPLRQSPLLGSLLVALGDHPILGLLLAAVLTALVCSSAATLGLAVTMADQGLLSLQAALPVMLGANIGTCGTALASALGANVEARRVAVAHAVFKVLGVLACLPFLTPFAHLLHATATGVPRQLANAHSLFNVGMALAFLPFTPLFARALVRLVPERPAPGGDLQELPAELLETPAVALGHAMRKTLQMADLVVDMVAKAWTPFTSDDLDLLLDLVDSQITYRSRYLVGMAMIPVRDLVMLDPFNPRSVAFQVEALKEHLAGLPALQNDGMPEEPTRLLIRLAGRIETEDAACLDGEVALVFEQMLMSLSNAIADRYFLQGSKATPIKKLGGLA